MLCVIIVFFKAPQNPCEPNPCGMHALCELDNGNPVCFCPKGMTGNPFKQCSMFSFTSISKKQGLGISEKIYFDPTPKY